MPTVFEHISACVQSGKSNRAVDIPPGSAGQPGAVEWIEQALADGADAQVILRDALMPGMAVVGKKFAAGEVFIPEVLIAARAMKAGFAALKPAFADKRAPVRGTFVIGTVRGDLHDIGKNLVGIILEGAGWHVVDLGTDCPPQRFVDAVREHPGCAVGLSALLTTTMVNMPVVIQALRTAELPCKVLVGGAPLTPNFAHEIGADGYGKDPTQALDLLDRLMPTA